MHPAGLAKSIDPCPFCGGFWWECYREWMGCYVDATPVIDYDPEARFIGSNRVDECARCGATLSARAGGL